MTRLAALVAAAVVLAVLLRRRREPEAPSVTYSLNTPQTTITTGPWRDLERVDAV